MRLSDAEWKVMRRVWALRTATAREVLEAVGADTGWAYSTVKTMLTRLAQKNALDTEMRGNTTVYRPRISEDDAQRSAVRSLLDRAFDGTFTPMLRFLADDSRFTDADRDTIRQVLDRAQADDGETP